MRDPDKRRARIEQKDMIAFALVPEEPASTCDDCSRMTPMATEPAPTRSGFYYQVSDEQLRAFAKLTPLQRLQWLDQIRSFTLLARTPQTAERQERLRRGETIV